MLNCVEQLMLTQSQSNMIEKLANFIDKKVCDAFDKNMNFILTVNDPDKKIGIGFSISTLPNDEVFQIYIDIFSALKKNIKKDKRIDFTRKLVSEILQNTEEKEDCFYWLLDELHKTENINGIKH